jgi:CTP synthase
MSPYEHGEVYVLDDSGEVDLDLGNYERFLDTTLTRDHNITTGKIYRSVLDRERRGDYLGKTVQVVPHITDECQNWIERVAQLPVDKSGRVPDICMIELGGTVGDIESEVYLESLRQFKYRFGADNFCHVNVSLAPTTGDGSEQKSKPTQHAVKCLLSHAIPPDLIFCRSTEPLDRSVAKKISSFCMVPPSHVISVHNCSNVMHVPQLLLDQNVPALILQHLRINRSAVEAIPQWSALAHRVDNVDKTRVVKIGLVGKYTSMHDAYLSVTKSLFYASIHCDRRVEIVWIEAADLEQATKDNDNDKFIKAWADLKSCHGILVPGGFGDRGVEGMILAVHYARERKVPFLGICLGFQVAVIEFCRSQLQIKTATSGEFDQNSPTPVIVHMNEISKEVMGGTMRLGSHTSLLSKGSIAQYLYGKCAIKERHRHRYEVNPEYIEQIHQLGGRFTGTDEKRQRMECFELDYIKHPHPFFFGVQFHPEFLSRPLAPSPPFLGLILAASGLLPSPVSETVADIASSNSNSPSSIPKTPSGNLLISQQRHPAFPPLSDSAFAWNPTSNALTGVGHVEEEVQVATQVISLAPPQLFIPGEDH